MNKTIKIKVYGRVQGVFFRANAKRKADQFNIRGYAFNTPNGGVEILAQGEPQALEQFLDWIKIGPKSARIEKIETKKLKFKENLSNFDIKY